jgi:uncharacterized membrane protein YfcA
MNIYFPIAEINANIYFIAGIGMIAGFLSNIFGIGGGFIATPFLIAIGVPPYIATACATQQIIGSSLMGVFTKLKPISLDYKLAIIMAMFGIMGSYVGVMVVQRLKTIGQVDTLISLSYVIVMTTTAFSILLRFALNGKKKHERQSFVDTLPWQVDFPYSGKKISIIFLGLLGFLVGILTGIMGIGGGFIVVPIMTYTVGIKKNVIIGTSLLQIFIITLFVTAMNIFKTESLDLLLGIDLIVGGVLGSFLGNIVGRFIKFEHINFLLALLILLVSLFFVVDLVKTPGKDSMFTLEAVNQN